jgi:hypothetical protein
MSSQEGHPTRYAKNRNVRSSPGSGVDDVECVGPPVNTFNYLLSRPSPGRIGVRIADVGDVLVGT